MAVLKQVILSTFSNKLTLVFLLALATASCKGSSSPFAAASTAPSSAGGTTSSSSCTTTFVDQGSKGTSSSVTRGTYSDTKMNPVTGYPATAFADPSSLSLKISYWNGLSFIPEVVAGDGDATFVKLAFLSTGVPMVFWAEGLNVKFAMRSAPLPGAGTWSSGIIDTGANPRAISASVSPLNQVAVVFITDAAAATGRAKFLYCDAPCTGSSAFQTMTTTPYIENTNVVVSETATGVAWCKSSSTVYYPAATYSITGLTRYAVCQNTLANCLTNTNWTPQTVVATGNVASRLFLDSTVTGDVARVASPDATGIVTYKMGATLCTAAPAAFTVGATLGGGTSGSQWLDIMKDSTSGTYHIAANESVTSVRYYNSTSTDFTSTWNAAGIVETVTMLNPTVGGADYDSTTRSVFMSYATNTTPFDIRLGRADSTVASNVGAFTKYAIDLTGELQLTASQRQNVSVASTSAGRPAVAYVDFSVGATSGALLKYAFRNGTSSTNSWTTYLVPDATNPQFPALQFDNNNHPWVSYFESSNNRFYLVTNSVTDGSGVWTVYEFPATPAGAPVALPSANNTALAMSYSNTGIASPVMLIIDSNAGSRGVKAAKLQAGTLTWTAVTTLDALTVSGASNLAADFDTNGNLVVAYRELNITKSKYSYSANGTSWTTPLAVSGVGQGVGTSIKINPVTTKPAISYYDRSNNAVYYSSCTNTLAGCATAGWSATLIDSTAGVSGLSVLSEQALNTGLTFSSSGTASVVYLRGQNLTLADNSSGSFVLSNLASGVNGALTGSAAVNFAKNGWNVSLAKNAAGQFTAVYVGAGDWLTATSCGD